MRIKVIVLCVAGLVALSLSAAEADRKIDPVPLRNWAVPFDQLTRPASTSATGRMVATTNALPSAATNFIAIAPCRIVDTRNANGPFGGPFFTAGSTRTYTIPSGPCAGIPVAAAYSLNFTIINYDASAGANGFVTAFPDGVARPTVSTVNFGNGAPAIANAAVVPASATGTIAVFASAVTNLIIDINGYFTAAGGGGQPTSTENTANTIVLRDANGGFRAGEITATKVLGAVYQDLAEWVLSPNMAAGTVVVLDPADGRRVIASSRAYDTAVAGVVSANPGIVLGPPGPDKSQIATTGRVKVFVDADISPIRVGDLLVTSETPGMAMKSQPMTVNGRLLHQPGTIIGKALEPLQSGKGEILILLSLQ